jgi:hypothetical protein
MRKAEPGKQINVRLQADLVKRVGALRLKLAKDSKLAAVGRVTTATVVKLAIAHGLDALEAQYK